MRAIATSGFILILVLLSPGLVGCVRRASHVVGVPTSRVGDLDTGAANLVSDLRRQLRIGAAHASIIVDPFIDAQTGQQTAASALLQQRLQAALARQIPALEIIPFNSGSASTARYVITGTITRADTGTHQYRISVALTDRNSGIVIAQGAAVFEQAQLDIAPTRFYADSPSLVARDRSVEGQVRTAQTRQGQQADALYIEQLSTGALLAEALAAYNEERWQDALDLYTQAVARPDGQQLRTFNGLYLTNIRLNDLSAAEEAFGHIVTLGLATDNLAIKLLFRPASTEFWPGPEIRDIYPMWLRQLARGISNSGVCLTIVGHTSRSGNEEVNERLSLERADSIRQRLLGLAGDLSGKLEITGRGFHDNLIGTGADDASDAVDRRVEFRVNECPTR